MKPILICILLLTIAMSINAQTVTYTYDAAGNRTARVVTVNKSPAAPQTMQEPEVMTDISDIPVEKNIVVYPNPTTGVFKVEIKGFTHEMHADFRLTDLAGKTVSHHKIAHGSHNFDLSHQLAGIYLLHVTINGKSAVWKIVKK